MVTLFIPQAESTSVFSCNDFHCMLSSRWAVNREWHASLETGLKKNSAASIILIQYFLILEVTCTDYRKYINIQRETKHW